MKHLSTWIAFGVMVAALVFLGRGRAAQAAPNALTAVCGTISNNTTWTTSDSPYQVCGTGATIAAGVTVTVQSGVTVKFLSGSSAGLTVHGNLSALGDLTQPITFTGVTQSPGSWLGINADGTVLTPAVVSLSQVTLDYGGSNAISSGAQVYGDHATLIITHSRLLNGQNKGVDTTPNASVDVEDTALTNNGSDALHLIQPTLGLVLSGLTASGNGLNAVYVGGTTYLHGQRHWPAAGIPYVVDGLLGNFSGDTLTIDAASELQFTSIGVLSIAGDFEAVGLPGAPITLTGRVKSPGAWTGVVVYGGTSAANAELENVTLEYGGGGAGEGNASVTNGYLVVRHSIIRNSARDGVRIDAHAHAAILNSQITGNAGYGVRNTNIFPPPVPTQWVLASNDWWGDPAGPTADVSNCSPGHGDKVTKGVVFGPVLTSTTSSAIVPLSNAPIVTLTPRRWFAPADDLTKIYFDIHVADGNGAPLGGRQVRLISSRGTVTDGGITGADGNTLAWLVSSGHNVGDADVTAALDVSACEGAISPTARVTFQTPVDITDLFPDSPASYFDGNIGITPEPVIVGVPTTLSVKLTNPLSAPITVDVSLGYAQAGIGLQFGPVHDWVGQVIPAHGSLTLSTIWLPPISGHYCLQVTYDITHVGSGLSLPAQGGSGGRQRNLNAFQGGTGSSEKNGQLDKTRNALDVLSGFFGNAFDTNHLTVQSAIVDKGIAWQLSTAEQIDSALHGDPPRQDYQDLTGPHTLDLPPVAAGGGLSAARANALNALEKDLAEANAAGRAVETALDRSGGASEAGNLQWASIQSAAVIEYDRQMGTALISASVDLNNLLNIAASEGVTSTLMTPDEITTLTQHLQAGWSAQEISDGHAVGLTDDELETMRKQILEELPKESYSDLVAQLQDLQQPLNVLGTLLVYPYAFEPHGSVSGGAGLLAPSAPAAGGNTLVQLASFTSTVQVGNPLTSTKNIDLSIRRISLPTDWSASVSPAQVTLAPGAVTTVTVTIVAGSPLLQGSQPQVAVEGYAGSQLLGGVVVEAVAPNYVFFDGSLHLWLPLARR